MHLLLLLHELLFVQLLLLFSLHILVDYLVLLTVEVNFLDLADLLVESLNLELVGVDLRLVVLEFPYHLLELHCTLLEVLLINLELLSDLRARLLGQDILKLNVELLFLLDEHILL